MSFLRHPEIFPPMGAPTRRANAPAHRLDEFPAGYSLTGCAPAEPVSASPAGHQYALQSFCRSRNFQRTARCVLTVCVSRPYNRIVIRLDSTFHYDIGALTPAERATFETAYPAAADYKYADFKRDVLAALEKSFGTTDVKPNNKAIKIKANGTRRSADVVVATEFRRYHSGYVGLRYESGICFFTSSGNRIVNYPKQHSANCTTKHQATNGWFKPMVRILKNMRSKLVDTGKIANGSAPSYFLECLLYNVPNSNLGRNYVETFVAAMNWILKVDRSQLLCANEQYYLVRDSAAECWPYSQCDQFINAAVDLWNNWQ